MSAGIPRTWLALSIAVAEDVPVTALLLLPDETLLGIYAGLTDEERAAVPPPTASVTNVTVTASPKDSPAWKKAVAEVRPWPPRRF